MRRILKSLVTGILLVGSTSAGARAQTREGFWISGGGGRGALACESCDGNEVGDAFHLSLGGTLNRHWLVGALIDGWIKEEGGNSLSATTLVVGVRWYPSDTSGFFLTTGIGTGSVDQENGNTTVSQDATGALFGLGYDIRIARNVSVTPYVNWVSLSYLGGSADFNNFGVALTIH